MALSYPIINDQLVYIDDKDKRKGYSLKEGES